MTRLPIRHGLFSAGLPSGEWAVLLSGQHVLTHVGAVDLPGFDIGYLEITNTPAFRIAGQAQVESTDSRRGTWEWSRSRSWQHITQDAPGSYPVLYDSQGNLHIATPDRNGSQGWRYEDEQGVLVTGDDTLNQQRVVGLQHGITDLWEYSHFSGVTIGQGDPPMGCHVLIDGQRRLLEPGACFFIRVRYRDGRWAVSMTKLAESEAVLYWLTRDELSALPLVGTPEPTPPPEPEPPVSIPDLSHIVEQLDREHPHLLEQNTRETATEFLWRAATALAAEDPKFGLLTKDPSRGENHILILGKPYSIDALAYQGSDQVVDLMRSAGDGPGTGGVSWGLDDRNPWNVWAPVPPFGGVTPQPPEPPPPTEPLPADALARVEALLVSLGKHLGMKGKPWDDATQ